MNARWRLLLLPLGAAAELLTLSSCWIVAVFSHRSAERMMRWANDNLPSLDWYMGVEK